MANVTWELISARSKDTLTITDSEGVETTFNDVVVTAFLKCTASNETDSKTLNHLRFDLDLPTSSSFAELNTLSNSDVLEWALSQMDATHKLNTEEALTNLLNQSQGTTTIFND